MHEVLHPSSWKAARGYANGVAAEGRMVFTGGMVGWTGDCEFETDDFVGQVEQALRNIVAVLAEAGARPEHLVRLTWYVTDKAEYLSNLKGLGAVYKDVIGRHYPAMALVQVVALVEDRAKVEIEATAVVPKEA
ncbi:MAG: RidA family protein [Rhodobacteraceae bacterium]|jgi:enamine deaminase RidA (YjgF/YER057c/UK114 family)|nr:RidA family protein [Paracoccaceae bacterium]MCF8514205.1 RidA family protein [Paracoccaceae bacterium]MCF8518449.1 RidA family protein [Paracoccaceae bacterium]